MSTSRAWRERRRTKESRALRRMALETISWSSAEEKVHWAASRGRPFHGMGVDSNEMAGGGVSGGGGTKVAVGVFWGGGDEGDCTAASAWAGGAGNKKCARESALGEAGSEDGGPIPGRGFVRMRGPEGARMGRSCAVDGRAVAGSGAGSSRSMTMRPRWKRNAHVG